MPPPSGEITLPATRRTRKSIGASTDLPKSLDKENTAATMNGTSLAASRKKSRSKSMGPGGLDALKQGNGNRRASLAVLSKPPPRSILKPTISLLPEIPPLKKRGASSDDQGDKRSSSGAAITSGVDTSGSKIALRTEEEQQAAARAREEKERRDARRKSLANRRVSFAAEATLHTFHEVEYAQDSKASADSSRRASGANKPAAVNDAQPAPLAQIQAAPKSLENNSESHENKLRRGSGVASSNFNDDDDTIASTIYSSDSEPPDAVEEIEEGDSDDGSSSNSSDDGTMVSVEDVTGTTMGSHRSMGDADETSTIDEALRIAAQRAGNHGGREDEDELDDGEEVIPSFGWVKKAGQQDAHASNKGNAALPSQRGHSSSHDDITDMGVDMDMTSVVGGKILKSAEFKEFEQEEDMDMSMDVTQAFGGILAQNKDRLISPISDEGMDEATMDLTTAIGGIRIPEDDEDDLENHEEMSMELTTAMGGVLAQFQSRNTHDHRGNSLKLQHDALADDATMEMTMPVGRILSAAPSGQYEDAESDITMGMDMTTAIGGIVKASNDSQRALGKKLMEEEVNRPNNPNKAILAAASQGPSPRRSSAHSGSTDTTTLEVSAFKGKGLRRSNGPLFTTATTTTPPSKSKPQPSSRTPSPEKPTTPQRGSRSASRKATVTPNQEIKSVSPRRTRSGASSKTPSPAKPLKSKASPWHNDPKTGNRTPTVVLTPQRPKLSGLGADRPGLGSPKVSEIFDRRTSIGEAATDFIPGRRIVAFEDPRGMAQDVDKERQDEDDKENRRSNVERHTDGADDKYSTLNLRGMIDSLSPVKRSFKSRKSLHVGSASGLLGKRPAELDDEEDTDDNDGVERLKGHQSSPVKRIRLQQPPTAAETTGRLTRSTRFSEYATGETTPRSSPFKSDPVSTPRNRGRAKTVADSKNSHTVPDANDYDSSPVRDLAQNESQTDEDRIHLQDFLNMTSIRFMELTTTKRRHTIAPATLGDGSLANGQDDLSLERCVVSGACTVPMLELYQHSCRELKKYISEGRRMVGEIESDTFEDNPPLFREYMSATSDVKTLMDNQFKNVKTYARFQSKAMWYEWRMKLQEGLKEGLVGISDGMDSDDKLLKEQQDLLDGILPALVTRFEGLEEECGNLEEAAHELADCDPMELQTARDEMVVLDEDIAEKKRLIARLRQEFETTTVEVDGLEEQKQNCLADIQESEKIRQECRGWTSTEINALKGRVDAIEKEHGWAVTGLSGTTLSMAYKRDIELVFDIASFQPHQPNSRIDLWYIADSRDNNPVPKTAEKEFFLQCIRDHVRALPQCRIVIADLLAMVRVAWDKACLVSAQINRINVTFPTTVTKTSDSSIAITSSLLLVPLETRVETTLNLHGRSGPEGVEVGIAAQAGVIYGENFNIAKMGEFLTTRLGDRVGASEEQWSDVLVELHGKLIARGRKSKN